MPRFLNKTLSAATAMFCAFSLPASAAALLYDCDMGGSKRNNGWTSPKIAFVLPGDGSVTVIDALTLHFNGKPLAGTLARDSKTHMHIHWTLKDVRSDNGTTVSKFDYKAVVTKANGRIHLSARTRSFAGGFTDQGRCETRKK